MVSRPKFFLGFRLRITPFCLLLELDIETNDVFTIEQGAIGTRDVDASETNASIWVKVQGKGGHGRSVFYRLQQKRYLSN